MKSIAEHVLSDEKINQIKFLGLKNIIQYFFFQRIARINSHVPWPVHWSSVVISPGKIQRTSWRPFPGYMPGQYIQAINGIKIGEKVRLGPGVKIISANHNLNDYSKHDPDEPVVIGDYCWLGANSIILPGVTLGKHVIVAAGAVVAKSFNENDIIIGGVPAHIIKKIEHYKCDQTVNEAVHYPHNKG